MIRLGRVPAPGESGHPCADAKVELVNGNGTVIGYINPAYWGEMRALLEPHPFLLKELGWPDNQCWTWEQVAWGYRGLWKQECGDEF